MRQDLQQMEFQFSNVIHQQSALLTLEGHRHHYFESSALLEEILTWP
jgi:hypothetical protein